MVCTCKDDNDLDKRCLVMEFEKTRQISWDQGMYASWKVM